MVVKFEVMRYFVNYVHVVFFFPLVELTKVRTGCCLLNSHEFVGGGVKAVVVLCQLLSSKATKLKCSDVSSSFTMGGQACVANPNQCVRTNGRFSRAVYIVVRRRMPTVEEHSMLQADPDTRKMSGILTTYRQGASVLSMRADGRGNLAIKVWSTKPRRWEN